MELPGLEPGITTCKAAVLPLHHSPMYTLWDSNPEPSGYKPDTLTIAPSVYMSITTASDGQRAKLRMNPHKVLATLPQKVYDVDADDALIRQSGKEGTLMTTISHVLTATRVGKWLL